MWFISSPVNRTFSFMLLSVLSLLPSTGLADSPKLAPEIANNNRRGVLDVIIQFNVPAEQQRATISQAGGVHQADLPNINGALYSIPAVALDGLAHNPNVTYISPDRPVQATLDSANPAVGAYLGFVNGWDGTGVGVAIIDSGILQTNDLLDQSGSPNATRIVYSASFIPKVTSTADQYGHGTHVAGIIAGNATASSGTNSFKTFRGMAPNAKLINLRVLDGNGAGADSNVINAIMPPSSSRPSTTSALSVFRSGGRFSELSA